MVSNSFWQKFCLSKVLNILTALHMDPYAMLSEYFPCPFRRREDRQRCFPATTNSAFKLVSIPVLRSCRYFLLKFIRHVVISLQQWSRTWAWKISVSVLKGDSQAISVSKGLTAFFSETPGPASHYEDSNRLISCASSVKWCRGPATAALPYVVEVLFVFNYLAAPTGAAVLTVRPGSDRK